MRLFKLKDADVWQKGTNDELMMLIDKMISNGQYKQILDHYKKRIDNSSKKNDWRKEELSRNDVWEIIRRIDDPEKKADFIAAGAFLARAEPYSAYSLETQERYYKQEHEFSAFVMKQIPDEYLWARICSRVPTEFSSDNGTRVVLEAITLVRDLFEHIQSEELLRSLLRYEQYKGWKKSSPKPEKKQPETQEEWIKIAMEDSNVYIRMEAAAHITETSLIPDSQKERCAKDEHLWVDAGSTRQTCQYGTSVDRRKCIYCGKVYIDVNYGD